MLTKKTLDAQSPARAVSPDRTQRDDQASASPPPKENSFFGRLLQGGTDLAKQVVAGKKESVLQDVEDPRWVAFEENTIDSSPDVVFRFVLWRWGKVFDHMIVWLEGKYPELGKAELLSFFSGSRAAKVVAEQLLVLLQHFCYQPLGIRIPEGDRKEMIKKAPCEKAFIYHMLLNLVDYLRIKGQNDPEKTVLQSISQVLDVLLLGRVEDKAAGLLAAVFKEYGVSLDQGDFITMVDDLKCQITSITDLLEVRNLSPKQQGLQRLFDSEHPNALEFGKQVLCYASPVHLLALANKYPRSGSFFCSDVNRFCRPLLDQLWQDRAKVVLVHIKAVAEKIVQQSDRVARLSPANHAVLLTINSPSVYRAIAALFTKRGSESKLVELLADNVVQVEDVCRFIPALREAGILDSFTRYAANKIDGNVPDVAVKLLLANDEALKQAVLSNLDIAPLFRLIASPHCLPRLADVIYSLLASYVSKDSRFFIYSQLANNVEFFLSSTEMLKSANFLSRCTADRNLIRRVLEVLTSGQFAFIDKNHEQLMDSFSCEFIMKVTDSQYSTFWGTEEGYGYLRKLFNKNPRLDRELLRTDVVVNSLFKSRSLSEAHWVFLYEEVLAGRRESLLSVEGGLGGRLWRYLCDCLSEGAVDHAREKVCGRLQNKDFAREYLQLLTRSQRATLFNYSDELLTRDLISICIQDLLRVLLSVLNTCFVDIENVCFYEEISRYPGLVEYALTVASSADFEQFKQTFSGHSWMAVFIEASVPKVVNARPMVTADNRDYHRAVVRGLIHRAKASEKPSTQWVCAYFNSNDPAIRFSMFANVVLANRLLPLRERGLINVNLITDVVQELDWITGEKNDQRISHLLTPDGILARDFIGLVEMLFCRPSGFQNRLLERLFLSPFWRVFFTDITIEQMSLLSEFSQEANEKLFRGEFAGAFPLKVGHYYAFCGMLTDDFYTLWKQTNPEIAHFIQAFHYRGDKSRWLDLLSLDWCLDIKREVIVDKLIGHYHELNIESFLKELTAEEKSRLFGKNPYFAESVIVDPVLLKACEMRLSDFMQCDFKLFLIVISDPELHEVVGITSEHFYNLIVSEYQQGHRPSVKARTFLGCLLSPPVEADGYAARYLAFTWNTAPACVKKILEAWGCLFLAPEINCHPKSDWEAYGVPYPRQFDTQAQSDACQKEIAQRKIKLLKAEESGDWQSYVNYLSAANERIFGQGHSKKRWLEWVREVIALCHEFQLSGLEDHVKCFLQLPTFKPTTSELSPTVLVLEPYFKPMREQVTVAVDKMVEYLIDICHAPVTEARDTVRNAIIERERELVLLGISAYYQYLHNPNTVRHDDGDSEERFVCLMCSATKLLEAKSLLSVFNANPPLRDFVCDELLTYDLRTLPAYQASSIVRLQLIILRSLLEKDPTSHFVMSVFWHLHCLPEAVIALVHYLPEGSLESSYHLQSAHWAPLKAREGLVSILRYAPLTSRLGQQGLLDLIETPALAWACLYYDHLFEKLQDDEAILQCVSQLGYGDDPEEVANILSRDFEFLVEDRPRLRGWIHQTLATVSLDL